MFLIERAERGMRAADNAYAKLYEKYYGVKLLSKSLLADADQIRFTMRNTKGETVEMPEEQWFVQEDDGDTTVVY